jgi:predicted ATPase
MRGEIGPARQAAESWLRAAEEARSPPDIAAADRNMGATLVVEGDLAEGEKYLEEAIKVADRAGNLDPAGGAGSEPAASAAAHLSLACWIAGEPDRSRALIEDALARSGRIAHVPTQAVVRYRAALSEMLRGDARASLPISLAFIDFCQARGVEQFLGGGAAISAWARARLEGNEGSLAEFRQSLVALSDHRHRLYLPFYLGRLAEIELAQSKPDLALGSIEAAHKSARDTGQRVFDAFLERVRGGALLADRANAPAAEAAFLSAIETSRRQGARSFGLQAALALAKFYQATGRPAEAHAVLTPALEGFAPTPEMPEIAEAQALLSLLA